MHNIQLQKIKLQENYRFERRFLKKVNCYFICTCIHWTIGLGKHMIYLNRLHSTNALFCRLHTVVKFICLFLFFGFAQEVYF